MPCGRVWPILSRAGKRNRGRGSLRLSMTGSHRCRVAALVLLFLGVLRVLGVLFLFGFFVFLLFLLLFFLLKETAEQEIMLGRLHVLVQFLGAGVQISHRGTDVG